MSKALKVIKKETLELLPAFVYFFVAFNLIVATDALTTEQYGIHVFSFLSATIGALVAAKAILLANLLPFMDAFPHKPLIYNTLWKTFIYVVASLVIRYIEHMIPFMIKYKSLVIANHHLISEIDWPRFWAIQIWIMVLLLVFVAFQELSSALGDGRLRQMFFGS